MSTPNQINATSRETGVETAEVHEMAHKIDRLSLLPNELLDHIFDFAYSLDTPSTGALSKRLLPFHITGIYRRIHLARVENVVLLIQTVNRALPLGEMIRTLDVDPDTADSDSLGAITEEELRYFHHRSNRLESLSLGDAAFSLTETLMTRNSTLTPLSFPHLRYLHFSLPYEGEHAPPLDFRSFPILESLSIAIWDVEGSNLPFRIPTRLPNVSILVIHGSQADNVSVASLCSLCPGLTHLTLKCYLANYGDLLKQLPTTLTHLNLLNDPEDHENGHHCDHELFRFHLIEELTLDDDLYSYSLPSHLVGLANLRSLKLGKGQFWTKGMIDLVSGPNRLVSLRRLELNNDQGRVGTRFEVTEDGFGNLGMKRLLEDGAWDKDWILPGFDVIGQGDFTAAGVRKLLQSARKADVEVKGTLLVALAVHDAYQLDFANEVIWQCYRDRNLGAVLEEPAGRLPPLDLDALDPNNLKLVKTDLPDEGWFALTLEPSE